MIHTVYGRVFILYHIAYIKPGCAACRSLTTRWAESILCRVWVHQQLLLKERSLAQPSPPCPVPILDLLAGCHQVVRTGLIRNLTRLRPGPFPSFYVHTPLCFYTSVKPGPQICRQHNHNGLDHQQEQDCPQEWGGQPFMGEAGEQPVTWRNKGVGGGLLPQETLEICDFAQHSPQLKAS